jgi:hypothetical protein
VDDEFVANDILTNRRQYPKEEAPAAYKDFDAVFDSVKSAGITARRSPARSSRKPSSVAWRKRQVAVISIGHLFPGWGFRKSNTVTTRVFIDVFEFPKV